MKNLCVFLLFLFFTLFFSCSAQIAGIVSENGAGEIFITTSLGPATIELIQSVQNSLWGQTGNANVLDGQEISRSMASAPGVGSITLMNTGPASLHGSLVVSNMGDLLAMPGTENRFITYSTEGGSSSLLIHMDRGNAPILISMLSPDVEEYLLALNAPIVTGEDESREEYLGLLRRFYSSAIADEISSANILAIFHFPRPVRSALGGEIDGRIVEFNIPLLDVLVLEQPLRYEAHW